MTLGESMKYKDEFIEDSLGKCFEDKDILCFREAGTIPKMNQFIAKCESFSRKEYLNIFIEKDDEPGKVRVIYEIYRAKHSIIEDDVFINEGVFRFPENEPLEQITARIYNDYRDRLLYGDYNDIR